MSKKKEINVTKKSISLLLLVIMIFGMVQPIFAVSSSGSAKWVAGQWDSNVYTTDNKTSVGMLTRRLTNNSTGEQITTFCGEHFIESPTRNC